MVSLERSLGVNNLVIDTLSMAENNLPKNKKQGYHSQVKTKMAKNFSIDSARQRNAN